MDKKTLRRAQLDPLGREINNPVPVVFNTGLGKPVSFAEKVRRAVRNEISRAQEEQGKESFEEANDFDVDDDFNFEAQASQYELMKDELPIHEFNEAVQSIQRARLASNALDLKDTPRQGEQAQTDGNPVESQEKPSP